MPGVVSLSVGPVPRAPGTPTPGGDVSLGARVGGTGVGGRPPSPGVLHCVLLVYFLAFWVCFCVWVAFLGDTRYLCHDMLKGYLLALLSVLINRTIAFFCNKV